MQQSRWKYWLRKNWTIIFKKERKGDILNGLWNEGLRENIMGSFLLSCTGRTKGHAMKLKDGKFKTEEREYWFTEHARFQSLLLWGRKWNLENFWTDACVGRLFRAVKVQANSMESILCLLLLGLPPLSSVYMSTMWWKGVTSMYSSFHTCCEPFAGGHCTCCNTRYLLYYSVSYPLLVGDSFNILRITDSSKSC